MASTRDVSRPPVSPVERAPLEREAPLRVRSNGSSLPAPVREPAIPDPERTPAAVDHRLPAHQGKLGRIAGQLAGLSEDLRQWVELRIELVRAEIMEQVDFKIAQARQGAVVGVLAALGVFFLLVTLALGLGWWLGHPFWGFLIVTLLLVLGAALAYRLLRPDPPSTSL